ncbi:MAG: hypothetical protein LBD99_05660 [Candidatus Margulisbacteria bacterium]|jgi:indole-3-glycerol phosphate synthase/phosphoribosylanthranilate isomerase|nr:hypothetical protein [Candidatus Margulisiibacteriota bacterium]
MNILDKIVSDRRKSLARDRALAAGFPKRTIPVTPFFNGPRTFIIAEFKRASPAEGRLGGCSYDQLARDYRRGGVRRFSVLTEHKYFQGSLADLYRLKQKYPRWGFLRKDFLFCTEDIAHAYRAGADAVLLIAEILSGGLLQALIAEAHKYKLQVLCEAHSLQALQKILKLKNLPDAIGLNSRDLQTFQIQPDWPLRLKAYLPPNVPVVYESGVNTGYLLKIIGNAGFRAALIGTAAVRAAGRARTIRNFINALRRGAGQPPNFFTRLYAAKKNIYVKICGLTNKADVKLAARAGADAAGFIFVPDSPRFTSAELLRAVKNIKILKIAVVKKVTPEIKKLLRAGLLDAVQTYNEADIYALAGSAYLAAADLRRRALPVTLYDAPKTSALVKGRRIPARKHRLIRGQWLAGGLTPRNIRRMIRSMRPSLVDVSSGVEKRPGVKDRQKMLDFVQEVARA